MFLAETTVPPLFCPLVCTSVHRASGQCLSGKMSSSPSICACTLCSISSLPFVRCAQAWSEESTCLSLVHFSAHHAPCAPRHHTQYNAPSISERKHSSSIKQDATQQSSNATSLTSTLEQSDTSIMVRQHSQQPSRNDKPKRALPTTSSMGPSTKHLKSGNEASQSPPRTSNTRPPAGIMRTLTALATQITSRT